MLRTCIDTETSTKEYPPYTKAIYNNGGIYGKNGNLRNLHQRSSAGGGCGGGGGGGSMVTGATSMSSSAAATALAAAAAAEEFRRAFNSHHPTNSPVHEFPEDIPGLPRHRPAGTLPGSGEFSPR